MLIGNRLSAADKRRLAMLYANNQGGNLRQQLLDGAPFLAELTHTAVPQRATPGTAATFTRATTKTIPDHEDVLRTLIAGELGFPGARRVRNLVAASESVAGWINASGFTVSATQFTTTATAGFLQMPFISGLNPKGVFVWSMKLACSAGDGSIAVTSIDASDGSDDTTTVLALTSTPTRYSGIADFSASSTFSGNLTLQVGNQGAATNTVKTISITEIQLEDVTAQTTQTAGEYVSVGVESAPYYHGSMVDGVKCFPTDLAGNALPTRYTYDAVSLNGVAGTYVSTPDSVANSITGDASFVVDAALTAYSGLTNDLISKDTTGATELCYLLRNNPDGTLMIYWTENGTTLKNAQSTAAISSYVSANQRCMFGAHIDVDNGASGRTIKFYYSLDSGATWTQLGSSVVQAGVTSIYNGVSTVSIGRSAYAGTTCSGKVYKGTVYNGDAFSGTGTLAVDFNASRYAGGTTLTGSTGETWTLQGNAVIHPTNSPMLGYSAEGARTNLCLQSNAFTTTWVSAGLSTIAQNSTGPDGAISAWTLTDTNGVIAGYINQTIPTNLTAAPHTAAVYVGKTSGVLSGYPTIEIYTGAGSLISVFTLDTTNGIATPWTSYTGFTLVAQSAICKNYNEDFWRFEITFLATAATWLLSILPAGASSATFAGPAPEVTVQGSAVFYGAQVELGSFASSYIATTTAAVTRNADVLTYPSAGNVLDTAGWAYAEITLNGVTNVADQSIVGTDLSGRILEYDGTTSTRPRMYDGTNVTQAAAGTSAINRLTKVAGTWGGTTARIVTDTTAVVNGTFDGTMSTATAIGVGCFAAGGNQLDGTIRNVHIGQRQLSASETQAVTS